MTQTNSFERRVGEDQAPEREVYVSPLGGVYARPPAAPGRFDSAPMRDHRADSLEVQRDRRRKHLTVVYDERLRVSDEVLESIGAASTLIAADKRPTRWTLRTADAFTEISRALTEIAGRVRVPAPHWPSRLSAESVADEGWSRMLMEGSRQLDDAVSAALRPSAISAADTSEFVIERLRVIDQAGRALAAEVTRIQHAEAPANPPARVVDPMQALRDRHNAEKAALQARHDTEWATASAELKAARLAERAR